MNDNNVEYYYFGEDLDDQEIMMDRWSSYFEPPESPWSDTFDFILLLPETGERS